MNDPGVTPSVGIITPTTGAVELEDCLRSVRRQSYPHIVHYIVVDGPEHEHKVRMHLGDFTDNVRVLTLPEPTGNSGYYGHRIYAALPYLVNTDFVSFLDEDNWYEPTHIQSLVELTARHRLEWAYSLRNVVSKDGTFLCEDNCDSLGLWGQWYSEHNHIDTSCYFLKREIACKGSAIWNRKGYSEAELDPDKEFCKWLIGYSIRGYTTGNYTVNYRLGSSEDTIHKEFFIQGNEVMRDTYKHFPWRTSKLDSICQEKRRRRLITRYEDESDCLLRW